MCMCCSYLSSSDSEDWDEQLEPHSSEDVESSLVLWICGGELFLFNNGFSSWEYMPYLFYFITYVTN